MMHFMIDSVTQGYVQSSRISPNMVANFVSPSPKNELTTLVNDNYLIITDAEMQTADQGVPGDCLSVWPCAEVRLPLRATFFFKEVVCL